MSYRTYVNDVQIFGNHEYYSEWIDFIKSQGIEVSEEGQYEGYITDFMSALDVVEKIVLKMETDKCKKRAELEERLNDKTNMTEEEKNYRRKRMKSLFDFSYAYERVMNNDPNDKLLMTSLLDELMDVVESSYAFLPYTLFKICEDQLEKTNIFSTDGHFHCYKIKDGEKIHVMAR